MRRRNLLGGVGVTAAMGVLGLQADPDCCCGSGCSCGNACPLCMECGGGRRLR